MNKILNPQKITKYWKNKIPPDIISLEQKGDNFKDPDFPRTIDLKRNHPEIKWKRLHELLPNFKLFEDRKTSYNQITQGEICDCYLISTLSSLANHPNLINQKIRTKKREIGYYELIFFIDDEWQIVYIDDYFPSIQNKLIFSTSSENVIWGILLEKGWAKINGGYSEIKKGHMLDIAPSLTGIPAVCYHHNKKDFTKEKEKLFSNILNATNDGMLVTCSSENENREMLNEKGICLDHSYTILNAKEYKNENIEIKLIRLYNPHGKKQDKGKWRGGSSNWNEELEKYFQNTNENDGSFWIDINDYYTCFKQTLICYLPFGETIKTFHFKNKIYFKSPTVFKIKITEFANFSVSVLFKQSILNRDISNCIHPCICLVFEYDVSTGKIENYYRRYEDKYPVHLIEKLKTGYYLVWIYCKENALINDDSYSVVFSCEKKYNVEYIGLDEKFDIIQKLTILRLQHKSIENKLITIKDVDLDNSNLFYIIIYNNSNDDFIYERCKINAEVFPPYDQLQTSNIITPPHKNSALIIFRSDNSINNIHQEKLLTMFPGFLNTIRINEISTTIFLNQLLNQEMNDETENFFTQESSNYATKKQAELIESFAKYSIIDNEFYYSKINECKNENQGKYSFEIAYITNHFPKLDHNTQVDWLEIETKNFNYYGEFNMEMGEIYGRGVLIIKETNTKLLGYWNQKKLNGRGIELTINNSFIYDGEFKDNLRHGRGKFFYADGKIWEGRFDNNKRNSIGIMIDKQNDKKYLAQFEEDNLKKLIKLNKNEIERLESYKMRDIHSYYEKMERIFREKSISLSDTFYMEKSQSQSIRLNENEILSFLKDQLQELIPFQKQNSIKFISNSNSIYYGNCSFEGKKHGYGALFKDKYYYIGYFNNDYPDNTEPFKIYNKNQQIKYIVYLNEDYKIKDQYGTFFNKDGLIYKGYFQNWKPHGKGTVYYPNGDIRTGIYERGQCVRELNSYEHGLIYKNDYKNDLNREHYSTQQSTTFFDQYKHQYKQEIEHLLKLVPLDYSEHKLEWKVISMDKNVTYIGEMKDKKLNGRGCLIYDNQRIKYFIGYLTHNHFENYGELYNDNWILLYAGEFKKDVKHGFGKESNYVGFYRNGKKEGIGVEYESDFKRYEGSFFKGKRHGKGFILDIEKLSIIEVKYQDGNITEQTNLYCNDNDETIDNLFIKYSDYKGKFIKLKETQDSQLLLKGIRNCIEGTYIGEMNRIGFKHGRGVLISPYSKEYYVGYFKENSKEGKGEIYDGNGKLKYKGEFKNNKPFGKGSYFKENGDIVEGTFNEVGEGKGEWKMKTGKIYRGKFFAWKAHGEGKLYENHNNVYAVKYYYGKL